MVGCVLSQLKRPRPSASTFSTAKNVEFQKLYPIPNSFRSMKSSAYRVCSVENTRLKPAIKNVLNPFHYVRF